MLIVRISDQLSTVARERTRLFFGVLAAFTLCVWTVTVASAWLIVDVLTGLPDEASIRSVGSMVQATLLYDAHDTPAFTVYQEQRIDVPLSSVSPDVVRAIVAVEDQRFYEHTGIDVIRVAGAIVSNLREGRRAQGGSTLTQQLARQSFLTLDKTLQRKLKEVIVAARLERRFTKAEILELYLNKVYFGDGLYGIEAAALGYFGRHAVDLDVAEAALLAGLVKSPSTYAPTASPDRARTRRDLVLQQMRATGAIDQATYDDAVARPVELNDALRRDERFGLYFKEEVRRWLVDQFGWERVYQGGLKVYTTIDPVMQKAAESQVARALAEIEAQKSRRAGGQADGPPLQAALIAMDPHTGEVRALVGGRDFHESPFNRATQARRQPGSAFKPFVYAAALEAGYSPATVLTNLDDPVMTLQGEWVPEDGHHDESSMTMRAALRTSSNRAAVRMLDTVGIPAAVRYARQLGIESVPRVPSLALGSGEVTLLSLTAAFGAFADGGVLQTPALVRRVETADGAILYERTPSSRRAVSEATAFLLTNMMADVIDGGTAWTARREGFRLPAAGKTGTTNDYHDAWFVGFTPKLVAGVWVGYDQPKTIIANGYAAELAVPLWGRFMADATRRDRAEPFRQPAEITTARICSLSGKLAGEGCRNVLVTGEDGVTRESFETTEYFVHGTEPTDYCPIHAPRDLTALVSGWLRGQPAPIRPSTPATISPAPAATARPPATAAPAPAAPPAASADRPAAPPSEPEPEERRRGFWGRLFRR